MDDNLKDILAEERRRNRKPRSGHTTKGVVETDRPKGKKPSLTDALREVAEQDPGAMARIAKRIYKEAEKGEGTMATKAWDTILDRFDGKVSTPIRIQTDGLTDTELATGLAALEAAED